MTTKILVGCDPELFLRSKATGQIVSAHSHLPGTKLEPYKVPHGAIQVDGTAAEFNIDPATSPANFVGNIESVIRNLQKRLPEFDLIYDPTVTYPEDYFSSLPDTAKELGCNPDFNAYTEEVNLPPEGNKTTMRTASGHIHVGWTEGVDIRDEFHFKDCVTVTRQLDYYLGLFSLMWDPDDKRRSLYGKAGAFRVKPYGSEYRTLSNVWLRSQSVQNWVYRATQTAIKHLFQGHNMYDFYGDFAKDCIDKNNTKWINTKMGSKVYNSMGIEVPAYRECLEGFQPDLLEEKTSKLSRRKSRFRHAA